jgi:hypothetical protein
MVPRKLSAQFPEKLRHLTQVSNELTTRDHGFFYKEFIVDEMK